MTREGAGLFMVEYTPITEGYIANPLAFSTQTLT